MTPTTQNPKEGTPLLDEPNDLEYISSGSETDSSYALDNADDLPGEYSFFKSSKFRTITILFSILSLIFLLAFVCVILVVAVYKHFHSRNDHIMLNVHLKLSQSCEQSAIDINSNVSSLDPHQEIDLKNYQQPHITLYLTDFQSKSFAHLHRKIKHLVERHFDSLGQCSVTCLPHTDVSTYGMWEVQNDDCLQAMSDKVVKSISPYITQSAKTTIPQWIHSLPDEQRKRKISMIRKYGSPNVFSEFVPHVTLAYDKSADRLQKAFNQTHVPKCTYAAEEIAFGIVGPYGTVIRGKDKANFKLPPK